LNSLSFLSGNSAVQENLNDLLQLRNFSGGAVKIRALILLLALAPIFAHSTTAERLDPEVSPTRVTWQSDYLHFSLSASCDVEIEGGWVDRHCFRYFEAMDERDTFRHDPDAQPVVAVDPETVREYASFENHPIKAAHRLSNIVGTGDNTVYVRYRNIKHGLPSDDEMLITPDMARAFGTEPKIKPESPGESSTPYNLVRPIVLEGFSKAWANTMNNARQQSSPSLTQTKALLAFGYFGGLAAVVGLAKYTRDTAVPNAKKGASEAKEWVAESSHKRKVRRELEDLRAKDEAKFVFRVESLKREIRDALEEDDRDRAQRLMTKLSELSDRDQS
jgi:hypothetical protein